MVILTHIATTKPPLDDIIFWSPSESGKFTIASTYNLVARWEWPNPSDKWKVLWSWKGLERICYFLWLASHGKLLTNEERHRRHLSQNGLCPMCNGEI